MRFEPFLASTLVMVAASCVAGEGGVMPAAEPPVAPVAGTPRCSAQLRAACTDEEPNGRYLLGAVLDVPPYTLDTATEYFNVLTTGSRGKAAQVVAVVGGASLRSVGTDGVFSGPDPRFNGISMPSSDGRYAVLPTVVRGDLGVTYYRLDVRDALGKVVNVCAEAVPLAGTVARTGEHVATPGRITFACLDGAGGKCVRWAYAPTASAQSPLWGAHQACMQGVTADYCANGATSTRVGTMISFMDNVGINQVAPGQQILSLRLADWPPNPNDYYFETAFPPGHREATCVGKLRWPAITAPCVSAIPECGDADIDDMIAVDGSVMFFASRYNQLRLERWRSGPDWVTTVRGYHNHDQQKQPWIGYEHAGTDAILLRVPPQSSSPPPTTAVSIFESLVTGDKVLVRTDDPRFPAQTWSATWEGYVYTTRSAPMLVPLRLYKHRTTGDYVSTTMVPSAMSSEGYATVGTGGGEIIGYVAPAP